VSLRLALIGGRGYTGSELLGLVARHPALTLGLASSGSRAGQALASVCDTWPDGRTFVRLAEEDVAAHSAEAWVLAVPDGAAIGWARAIRAAHLDAVILDLSADHRFDERWVYGLPERNRAHIRGSLDISNPGCYATGSQLALLPLINRLASVPSVFGVSGYSGAGRTPSERNDPGRLADNLVPYQLTGHVHEKEVSHQLGRPVRFMPHVAAFFRGISLTVSARLTEPTSAADMLELFRDHYRDERFVRVTERIPEIRDVRGGPEAHVGGFAVDERDPRSVTLVAVLDNLAKGAATQAMQNLNLALGLEEDMGIGA
jgi:N-acetyl-gamma-glutamyl-phosphate reductase